MGNEQITCNTVESLRGCISHAMRWNRCDAELSEHVLYNDEARPRNQRTTSRIVNNRIMVPENMAFTILDLELVVRLSS